MNDDKEQPTEVRCECCGSYVHMSSHRHEMDGSLYIKLECNCEKEILPHAPTNWIPSEDFQGVTTVQEELEDDEELAECINCGKDFTVRKDDGHSTTCPPCWDAYARRNF